jgi:hypothetical protein
VIDPIIYVFIGCSYEPCRRFGVEWRVNLQKVAPGVVELPNWRCTACGSEMSLSAPIVWDWDGVG